MVIVNRRHRNRDKKYTEEQVERNNSKKILDLTEYKPSAKTQYNEDKFTGKVNNTKGNPKATAPIIVSVPESGNKELADGRQDMYEKVNSQLEPDVDDLLLAQGAAIISSSITVTDQSGNNHTYVKRPIEGIF